MATVFCDIPCLWPLTGEEGCGFLGLNVTVSCCVSYVRKWTCCCAAWMWSSQTLVCHIAVQPPELGRWVSGLSSTINRIREHVKFAYWVTKSRTWGFMKVTEQLQSHVCVVWAVPGLSLHCPVSDCSLEGREGGPCPPPPPPLHVGSGVRCMYSRYCQFGCCSFPELTSLSHLVLGDCILINHKKCTVWWSWTMWGTILKLRLTAVSSMVTVNHFFLLEDPRISLSGLPSSQKDSTRLL